MGFWDRMEKIINQGIESSKEVFGKAKEKAKDLSEKGVLKFEIMQLEKQAENRFAKLGVRVYEELIKKKSTSVSANTLKALLQDILDLKKRIDEKEEILKELDKKDKKK